MYIKIENKKSGYTYNDPVYSTINFKEINGIVYATYLGRNLENKKIPVDWIRYISD